MNKQTDNAFDEKTLADIDRHHLQAAARDAHKDVTVADAPDSARPDAPNWEQFAADATSPVSRPGRGGIRPPQRQRRAP